MHKNYNNSHRGNDHHHYDHQHHKETHHHLPYHHHQQLHHNLWDVMAQRYVRRLASAVLRVRIPL